MNKIKTTTLLFIALLLNECLFHLLKYDPFFYCRITCILAFFYAFFSFKENWLYYKENKKIKCIFTLVISIVLIIALVYRITSILFFNQPIFLF